jgi:hypothetical protein
MVREFVVCLSTGIGRLLISDSSAPHYGRRLPRYQKALDNAWVEYIYAPVRALPFWKLLLASLIASCFQNILLFTVHVSVLDFDRCLRNVCDRRIHSCLCLYLETSLFSCDNTGRSTVAIILYFMLVQSFQEFL